MGDGMVWVINNTIRFDNFYKPTWSGRYLNFHSNHPLTHKRGLVFGLVDKIMLLSHPEFHQNNFTNLVKTLLDNSYPINFILKNISKRIKFHIHNSNLKNINNQTNTDRIQEIDEVETKYFTIPYIKNFTDRFIGITKKLDCKLSFSCKNKLNSIIKTGKDVLNNCDKCDVVYHLKCGNCDANYVGQTRRKLMTRIKEHKKDVDKRAGQLSVISQHKIEFNHEFLWDDVKILDVERSYNKRLVSEMLHIKSQESSINKQTDTEFLPNNYPPILNSLLNR